jgi:enoyl-CoA hydratase
VHKDWCPEELVFFRKKTTWRTMMAYSSIITEIHDQAGLIQMNRPKEHNALNVAVMSELVSALQDYDADDNIGAIVITGNERAFAAGADIKEMTELSAVEMLIEDRIQRWDIVASIQKPIIAAVSGWCLGGGNELALACDMIIASESAKFGQPEIELGVIPGAGGTQRLTRAVGKQIAMEMVLTNRHLSAKEALQLGLIMRVVPDAQYLDEALKFANAIATRPPLATRLGKEMVNLAFETMLSNGLERERRSFYFLFSTEDQKEGMRAFMDKRTPEWTGK